MRDSDHQNVLNEY